MPRSTRTAFLAAALLGLAACGTTAPPLSSSTSSNAPAVGSAGDTLLLEVGPELKPCNHGVMRDAQCMQVRELTVDSAGTRIRTGEWTHFYGMIEGFVHEPGVRQVLRVKRSARENVPADASRYVYQLETRVEREPVAPR